MEINMGNYHQLKPNYPCMDDTELYASGLMTEYQQSVEEGFDTDCNGATVGSVLGMAHGLDGIPACWQAPSHDTLHTSIFGVWTVKISERVKMTMEHIKG